MSDIRQFYFGLPNQGRLSGITEYALVRMGISLEDRQPKQLYLSDGESGIEVRWVRGEDIPGLLKEDVIQLGVVGNDYVAESAPRLVGLSPLGWCAGHLCLIVHADSQVNSIHDLRPGTTIYSQYPKVTRRLLKQSHITEVRVKAISGAAEAYFQMDLQYKCNAIVDIVATGESIDANGLRIASTLLKTCAWLYSNSRSFMNIALSQFALSFVEVARNITEDTLADVRRANAHIGVKTSSAQKPKLESAPVEHPHHLRTLGSFPHHSTAPTPPSRSAPPAP